MSTVRGLALVVLAAGLFAYAAGWSSAATTRRAPLHTCPPPRARVIAQDRDLRIYSTGARVSYAYAVRACRRGARASMTLLSGSRRHFGLHHSVGQFVLAGDFVGYIETQFGVDSGTTTLIVLDVASKRTLHEIVAGHYVDAGFVFSEEVTDFVVSDRGSVAWITQRGRRGPRGSPEERTVQVIGPTGMATVADTSTTIDPTSLRLYAHTLRWSDAGVRCTAPMP